MRSCSYKKCPYPVFSTDKLTGLGYCKSHSWCRTDRDKRSPLQKHLDKAKQKTETTPIDEGLNMVVFYAKAAKEIKKNPHCAECNEFIPDKTLDQKSGKYVFTDKYYRAATAHILPKATFPNVAAHPLNYVIAGAGCGCHNKTHRWDTFQKMKVWETALFRIEMMFPELTQEEIRRLPQEVIDHIHNKQPF